MATIPFQSAPLKAALHAAGSRPPDVAVNPADGDGLAKEQRLYAMRFANTMAISLANGLRDRFPGVLPNQFGRGLESPNERVLRLRMLDVIYGTLELGLGFGISLKSAHFKDEHRGRYVQNRQIVDQELTMEATGYHQRQPYAVMTALLFLPDDACDDACGREPSSFGEWARYLRLRTGRDWVKGFGDLYEQVFIGLYRPDGTSLEFFDVANAPRRKGRPTKLLGWNGLLDRIETSFFRRNRVAIALAQMESDPP